MSNNVVIDCTTGAVTFLPLTPEQIADSAPTQTDYSNAIQAHIDATAQSRQYSNGFALASYVTSTIPAWAVEAQTFVAWRDQVWVYAYTELAKVQAAQRAVPTIAGFVGELPIISWP